MKHLTVGILIFGTMVFCADMTKAEKSYAEYLTYVNGVKLANTAVIKADQSIADLIGVIDAQNKEISALKAEKKEVQDEAE